ncbi:hypothetical protein HK103_004453 [Boothiomyces macroporosus]|uniref:Uncharacterized protein n=1 Tax=Boothiomyces macroporosus TaxID=261099 RepID=A0AAD5UKV5_9FUNG|nr:hypothetical protein HK103_004453 [Boothiomyces macroporosus]
MKFVEAYNSQWAPYISEKDYEGVLMHLNRAASKGPKRAIRYTLRGIIISSLLGFFAAIIYVASKTLDEPMVVFTPFICLFVTVIIYKLYNFITQEIANSALEKTAKGLSAQLESKNILVEYKRSAYAYTVYTSNNGTSSKAHYDYHVDIYHLRDAIQQPAVVLDMDRVASNKQAYENMTPEMQAQFSAFMEQQKKNSQNK